MKVFICIKNLKVVWFYSSKLIRQASFYVARSKVILTFKIYQVRDDFGSL